MSFRRVLQIAVMLAVPVIAVYVVAPAVRAWGGSSALFWVAACFMAFGVVTITLSRVMGGPRQQM